MGKSLNIHDLTFRLFYSFVLWSPIDTLSAYPDWIHMMRCMRKSQISLARMFESFSEHNTSSVYLEYTCTKSTWHFVGILIFLFFVADHVAVSFKSRIWIMLNNLLVSLPLSSRLAQCSYYSNFKFYAFKRLTLVALCCKLSAVAWFQIWII